MVCYPFPKNNRRNDRVPIHTTGWKRAVRLAEIQTDRNVEIVATQVHIFAVLFLPDLCVAWIHVEIYPPPYRLKDLLHGQAAGDIDQEIDVRRKFLNLGVREADVTRAIVFKQGDVACQIKPFDQHPKVARIGRSGEIGLTRIFIDAVLRVELFNVLDLEAEPAQSQHILQERPAVANAGKWMAGHGARDHNAFGLDTCPLFQTREKELRSPVGCRMRSSGCVESALSASLIYPESCGTPAVTFSFSPSDKSKITYAGVSARRR